MKRHITYLSESKMNSIISETVNNLLNESFNDNEISRAIEEHGGLLKQKRELGASMYSDYDLQNCKYKGYLSPNTINELDRFGLAYFLRSVIIYTNDGGAIVLSYEPLKNNDFNRKFMKRNMKWAENHNNYKHLYNGSNGYTSYDASNLQPRRNERKKF